MLLYQTEQFKRHLPNGRSVRSQRLFEGRSHRRSSFFHQSKISNLRIGQDKLKFSKGNSSNPQVLSQPHFLNVDLDLLEKIEDGMNANQTLHETFLDIEPVTGSVMRGAKRVQFNVEIFRNKSLE